MQTVIGIFSSRDRAEGAVEALSKAKVPERAIVFLSRSESETKTVARQFGATLGGLMGMATGASAGMVVATMLVPEIGTVFALGFGAAALLGTKVADGAENKVSPTPDDKAPEDVAFFREVLKQGRSLVVVRTESQETAAAACRILDRFGIGMRRHGSTETKVSSRTVAGISILDVSGRITIGDGSAVLREAVQQSIQAGSKTILLNLREVSYMDSSGIGELVRTSTAVRRLGGQLKLVNPSNRVWELLEMTRLSAVFDTEPDEATALESLGGKLVGGADQGSV
jgi:anti-sigma B factor antagonist